MVAVDTLEVVVSAVVTARHILTVVPYSMGTPSIVVPVVPWHNGLVVRYYMLVV